MNENEREVLDTLCNGDITFSEASEKLGVSKEKIEEMLEDYSWVPSSERLSKLVEMEMETLSYIKEISQPVRFRVLDTQSELRFEQMQFTGQVEAQFLNISPLTTYAPVPCSINVVINHTEDNGIKYMFQ